MPGRTTAKQEMPWSAPALLRAWEHVVRKASPYPDEVEAHGRISRDTRASAVLLAQQVNSGAYQVQPYRIVHIAKRAGGHRELLVPALHDRWLQHAASRWLAMKLDQTFSPRSFAYRPGLGVAQALAAAEDCLHRGNAWILDADIEQFFDRVAPAHVITQLKAHDLWHHRFAGNDHDPFNGY